MLALDIFGTVGTAISIVVMVHNILKQWVLRGQLQDLTQIIIEIEELYQNTTQEGLCVDRDTTAKYDRIIAYLRSDAEYIQARCAAAKNTFHLCWIMFRGAARRIEYLTIHAHDVRYCIWDLRREKRDVEDIELLHRGIGRRLGLTQTFTKKLNDVVGLSKPPYPVFLGPRTYEFDRYLTPPEANSPQIWEPLECDANLANLLETMSASPLNSLDNGNAY